MRLKNIIAIIFVLLLAGNVNAQTIPAWKITVLEEWIQKSDSPVIVSFWATWCKPCLGEIPYFEALAAKYKDKGVRLLLVSLDMKEDYPKAIVATIQKRKFASEVVWLNETNADYFCPKIDNSWSGALPATLLVNNKKGYRKFFEEAIPEEKLEQEIIKLIAD